jgi:hypothetical protein
VKTSLFHVGLAKCASTFFGDQINCASCKGDISAYYWMPWDTIINECFKEVIGSDIVAFPDAGNGSINIDLSKHFIASNECLTGHFPLPLRLVSHPVYTAEHLGKTQMLIAHQLKLFSEKALGDFKTKILLITREPESWLLSLYKNFVLMGVSQQPREFYNVFGELIAQWANVDFITNIYKELFDPDNVLVLPFEMLRTDFNLFSKIINEFTNSDIIINNIPKNSGLSNNATEYFRIFWKKIDKIAPSSPSWQDPTIRYKQQTWKYIHNTVMNDKNMVDIANAELGNNLSIDYHIPEKVVIAVRNNMLSLRDNALFSKYIHSYFP